MKLGSILRLGMGTLIAMAVPEVHLRCLTFVSLLLANTFYFIIYLLHTHHWLWLKLRSILGPRMGTIIAMAVGEGGDKVGDKAAGTFALSYLFSRLLANTFYFIIYLLHTQHQLWMKLYCGHEWLRSL